MDNLCTPIQLMIFGIDSKTLLCIHHQMYNILTFVSQKQSLVLKFHLIQFQFEKLFII